MPWSSGLRPEVIRELKERHPGLTLDEIAIEAAQRSEYADEFDRLDVRPYTGSEGFRMVFLCSPRRIPKMAVPVENAADFRDLVVAVALAEQAETDDLVGEAKKKPGRRPGSEVPIPDDTVLEILRLIVEENARPRAIAKATDGAVELSFVNRIKAGVIVKWAEKHPVKARRAVDRQEIPEDFPATDDGVLLPKLPKP